MSNPNLSPVQFGNQIEDMSKYTTVPHVEEEIALTRNNFQGSNGNNNVLASHMRRLNALQNHRQNLMGLKGATLSTW